MLRRAHHVAALLALAVTCTCTRSTVHAGARGVTLPQTMYVAGQLRTYLLHIPAHYDAMRHAPLVIVLHGHGETAGNFESYTGMSDKADARGFIVVYPQALGDPSDWHTAIDGPPGRDDITFVRDIIDVVERRYRIDRRRIFAAGHSNGGIMTYRLASALSDRIVAVGVTAGSIGMVDAHGDTIRIPPPAHPVSVIHFHGLADPSVPYHGGPESDGPDNIVSVKNTVGFWLSADRCRTVPAARTVSLNHDVIVDAYYPCASGTAVTLYTIIDGTHRWPGDDVPWYTFPGRDDSDVIATDVMWDFFAAHPRND
jgi:polyhydroxybutyrate depolymerase